MASAQHDICPICLEQPKNPKSLPTCTHLFCEACLNTYVRRHQAEESVACPSCTIACPIQDIKVEALDDSELVEEPTEKVLCTFCSYKGLDAEAESFCDRCGHSEDVFLCRDCATSHGKKARFLGHDAKPLSVFVRFARCTKHGGRVMKFLCMGCDAPACEVCADVGHDDHELVDIGDIKKQLHGHYDSLQDSAKRIPSLERELLDIQTAEERAITMVQQQAELIKNDFVNRVDKRRDDLLSAVRAKAPTRGKQLFFEMSSLSDEFRESLKNCRDIIVRDITNAQEYQCARSIEESLAKIRSKAGTAIFEFERKLGDAPAPRFIPEEGTVVGEIEYLQRKKTGTVRLELGGKYVRQPCYKIGPAVPFIRDQEDNQGAVSLDRNVAFFEKSFLRSMSGWSLQMVGLGKQVEKVKGKLYEVTDMIVNRNGELMMLFCMHGSGIYQYIPPVKPDDKEGSLQCLIQRMDYALSMALAKSGQIVILQKKKGNFCGSVSILSADFKVIWGSIYLDAETLHPEQDRGLKILCPESTDLLLVSDGRGEKVSAISLAVKQGSMVSGEVGSLQRYFAKRAPILPPVKGFYILDICCDDGKVYLCIKKGPGAEESAEAGPIQFYQATYTYDKWHYTAIPLEDPAGEPFSALKKDEMLQLGAHKGILMCLVYSPIPLAELKESAEPGMNLTWYHGKLP